MAENSEQRRLLFLDNNDSNPASRRTRSRSLDSRVRRHLMVDIGKSRRKPLKGPQFETLVWPLADNSKTQPSDRRGESPTGHDGNVQPALTDASAPDGVASYTTPYTMLPVLHTLSVFEKEWGEDWFSAYGFTLIMVVGKNALESTWSTNTFWFPFAFRNSAFLRHYERIFSAPNVLIPLYRRSAGELESLALKRSLVTMKCVGSRLASSDASIATSDDVIEAVLALACHNLTSMDFEQATIHINGIWKVIEARGGVATLEANQELLEMISWVDITTALLHDTKPLFPLPASVASFKGFHHPDLGMLPAPLIGVVNDESWQSEPLKSVMSCTSSLNTLATQLQLELATKGDATWDEEHMGLLTNPITHHLLNQQPPGSSRPRTRTEVVSEALRLGAIIWITLVKRMCRSYPGAAETRISSVLKLLSSDSGIENVWKSNCNLRVVRLWLLVLCGISGPSEQDHVTLMRIVAGDMRDQRSISWDGIMSNVRQMPWTDMFEPLCAGLGQELAKGYP